MKSAIITLYTIEMEWFIMSEKYTVNIEWTMTKTVEIEAENKEEAIKKAMTFDTSEGYYLEDSYQAFIDSER